jgi:hypothetical protein
MRDDQANIREHAAIVRAKRLTQLFAFSCLLSQGTDHLYHVEQLYRNETTVDGQRARRMSIRVCGPTTVDLSGIVSVLIPFTSDIIFSLTRRKDTNGLFPRSLRGGEMQKGQPGDEDE